jgi:tetratricopeptide (TPR) repeat protein
MVDEQASDLQAELDEALFSLEELIGESPQEALSMFESLPEPVQSRPEFKLSKARALQAIEALEEACVLCESLLREAHDPMLEADVHHLLADVLEDLGDSDRANEHFLRVLSLDRAAFSEHRHLTEADLLARVGELLNRVVDNLPDAAQKIIKGAQVELFPSEQDVRAGLDPRAFSALGQDDERRQFKVFAANLDAEYGDLEELGEFDEHVQLELHHQISDHLGL